MRSFRNTDALTPYHWQREHWPQDEVHVIGRQRMSASFFSLWPTRLSTQNTEVRWFIDPVIPDRVDDSRMQGCVAALNATSRASLRAPRDVCYRYQYRVPECSSLSLNSEKINEPTQLSGTRLGGIRRFLGVLKTCRTSERCIIAQEEGRKVSGPHREAIGP